MIHFKTVLSVTKHYYSFYVLLSTLQKLSTIIKNKRNINKKIAFMNLKFFTLNENIIVKNKIKKSMYKLQKILIDKIRLTKYSGFYAIIQADKTKH